MEVKNSVYLQWIEGDLMAADSLTKHTASKEHLLTLMNESKLSFIPSYKNSDS